jgi:uncharacterized protein
LRGVDNGVMDEPPVLEYRLGADPGWRALACWPPLPRDDGGTLVLSARDVGRYRSDPTTGILSGLWGIPCTGWGLPLDQHADDVRGLQVTGEPLAEDLDIDGRPVLRLVLTTSENDPSPVLVDRVVFRLSAVDRDGVSSFITAGIASPRRVTGELEIVMRAVSYRVRAGDRLRIVVSDADFPRLMPVPRPQDFAVAELELRCPVPVDGGDPAAVPLIDPVADAATRAPDWGGRWTITRDPINDGIEVAIGVRSAGNPPDQANLLEYDGITVASVRRNSPGGARLDGEYVMAVRMATGESIVAKSVVRLTQSTLTATGEVEIDGLTVFRRTWDAVLPDERR